MTTRNRWAAWTAAAVVLGSAGSAWALDGWRDRRGLFYGATVGFGGGKADVDGADRQIGLNFRGRVGGGVTQQVTLDADLGLHHVIEDVDANLFTGFVGANFFVIDNLYLRAMGGLSYLAPDPGDSQTGVAVGGGLGYEFFANSDLAVGGLVDFQQHFYDDNNFNILNFGVTITVY